MKRLLIVLAASLAWGCADDSFTVRGTLPEAECSVWLENEEGTRIAEAQTQGDGAFVLKGRAEEAHKATLHTPSRRYANLVVENGTIFVNADKLGIYTAEGTPLNDAMQEFRLAFYDAIERYGAEQASDDERRAIAKEFFERSEAFRKQHSDDPLAGAIPRLSSELETRKLLGMSGTMLKARAEKNR